MEEKGRGFKLDKHQPIFEAWGWQRHVGFDWIMLSNSSRQHPESSN